MLGKEVSDIEQGDSFYSSIIDIDDIPTVLGPPSAKTNHGWPEARVLRFCRAIRFSENG
jgi:hypothetical protein